VLEAGEDLAERGESARFDELAQLAPSWYLRT
jgi:hypothetical protein